MAYSKQGEIVKMQFVSSGYTVEGFAEALGMSQKTLQRRLKEDPLDTEFVQKSSALLGFDVLTVEVPAPGSKEELERVKKALVESEARERELKAQIYDLMKSKGMI
jgi:transcriptional regulator with XRE-family HTH domain